MRSPQRDPMDPPDQGGAAADGAATGRPPRERPGVLVVDDEHMVRIMVQLALERSDFDVWVAADGRDAIRVYRQHRARIDVVLLDVRMPGLDGMQTLDAIRELNPEVPACFMTGDTGAYRPEELRAHGAAHVFGKPFHLDQLAQILRLVAQGVPAEPLPNDARCRG